jgi:hypothetical protein
MIQTTLVICGRVRLLGALATIQSGLPIVSLEGMTVIDTRAISIPRQLMIRLSSHPLGGGN